MPKYKLEIEEKKKQFVARIVQTENAPLTANAVVALIDKRSMKKVKASKIHANLSDAVKHGLIGKTRFQAEGDSRAYVHYHPLDMVVAGESIPIPAFEKQGGYTRDTDADADDKPAAVKVAEQVIADIAGLPDSVPTVIDGMKVAAQQRAKQRVDIGTGWVDMENGVPKKFTPNAWTSIADCINATPEELTAMVVRHFSSRTIDHDHEVAGICFRLKEMLLNDYGLTAHRRK